MLRQPLDLLSDRRFARRRLDLAQRTAEEFGHVLGRLDGNARGLSDHPRELDGLNRLDAERLDADGMEVDAREERVGRVRVDVRVVLEVHLLDDLEAVRMVRGTRHDARQADLAEFLGREREFALRLQVLGKLLDAGAVAAEHVEEEALEARGARDVSGGRGRCDRLARGLRRVAARAKELVHRVVFVRADDEAHDRKPHLLGDPARVRIAEVAARHREDDLLAHAFDGSQIAVEVVDDLRHDAGAASPS